MAFSVNFKDDIIYYSADKLTAQPGVKHAFTTRFGGVSEGVYAALNLGFNRGDIHERVMENYRIVCKALDLDIEKCVLSKQVHGDTVRVISPADYGKGIFTPTDYEADALVTDIPGAVLIIFTADCVPILLYDREKRVIAAVHAGWKSTVQDIAGKAVETMVQRFGCRPENITAAIGHSIGKCCFETDGDVPDAVRALLGDAADEFIEPKGGKFHVDLKGINRLLLTRRGVPPENIEVCEHCTMCMPETYWSHRYTKGVRGSQASIISLCE